MISFAELPACDRSRDVRQGSDREHEEVAKVKRQARPVLPSDSFPHHRRNSTSDRAHRPRWIEDRIHAHGLAACTQGRTTIASFLVLRRSQQCHSSGDRTGGTL
ncbi:hypothetical protein BD309DRAFT_968703 [Dichomitus squalens]|nr:hypothetical protein BD309DRAFT_968703 [Dichomitus squalens]